jgi:hypothetical protein
VGGEGSCIGGLVVGGVVGVIGSLLG